MGTFAENIEALSDELIRYKRSYFIENPKFSIVIPAYNVEEYIYDCLISIIKQSLKDIEIIVIDDGSTDNTYSILSMFSKYDSRIKIIKQNNQKVGTAKNNGLQYARGKYIWFVDSDDVITENCLEDLYKIISSNNPDVIVLGAYNLLTNNKCKIGSYSIEKIAKKYKNKNISKEHLNSIILKLPTITGTKVCKRDFLIKNNILFQEGCSGEDQIHFISSMLLAEKVFISDKNFYKYRRNRKNSLTFSKSKTDNSALMNFYAIEKFLSAQNLYEQFLFKILDKYFIKAVSWLGKCHSDYKQNYYNELKLLLDYLKENYPHQYWGYLNIQKSDSYLMLKLKIFLKRGVRNDK